MLTWVSGLHNDYLIQYHLYTVVSLTCMSLPPLTNGGITYDGGSTNNRPVGTVATYTCVSGFTIDGVAIITRTCRSGVWSGLAPMCQSKWNELCTVCLLSVSSPIQLTALTYPH